MERKVACMALWSAGAANTLEAEVSMVEVEAEVSMVGAEAEASRVAAAATTNTRNIGETKLYNGNAQRGARAPRFFVRGASKASRGRPGRNGRLPSRR